jgi:hypothetical protein
MANVNFPAPVGAQKKVLLTFSGPSQSLIGHELVHALEGMSMEGL